MVNFIRLADLLKRKRIIIVIFLVALLILSSVATTWYLDNNKSNSSSNKLLGYDDLKKQVIDQSSTQSDFVNDSAYQKFVLKLNSLDNKLLSKEAQFKVLQFAREDLEVAYTDTNNHNLYTLEETFNKFMKTNFPNKKIPDSKPYCFDKTCAENPQPQEIINVIEEIKQSNIPDALKQDYVLELTNFGYLNNDVAYSKAGDYLIAADDIKNNRYLKDVGLDIKLSDEIINYVKNAFPEEYKKLRP